VSVVPPSTETRSRPHPAQAGAGAPAAGSRHRVTHVITRLELGGAQQNTLYSTAHHDRARFEPELLAGVGGYLDTEALAIAGARVELFDWLRHEISPWHDALAIVRLARHFRRRRVALVHTHSSKAGIVGRWAAVAARVPRVVHTVHGWSFNPTQPARVRRFYRALERATARVTDRIVVVAEGDRARGLAAGIGRPEQYALVRSGIDVLAFAAPARARDAVRRELGAGDDTLLVGTLSCLKPQKAPEDFVRAAVAAHALEPRSRFVLAGDGPLRAETAARIDELGASSFVRLLGWRRDVVDLLHAFDVFLLTSRFEGLPRAVLQAMAAGVPVVATAVDGTPEVVEHERTGLLVPAADPEAAAAAVVRLAREPGLARRCVENARSRLGREFDAREMVRALDRLYLELLEPGAEARGSAAP
jgi:glycosyltransferase involved in cell wall biosynthesis